MSDERPITGIVQCGDGEMTPFLKAEFVKMNDGIVISLPIKRSKKTDHGSPVKVFLPMTAAQGFLTELSRELETNAHPHGEIMNLLTVALANQLAAEESAISD